jgi:hypothetical protein
MGSDFSGDMCSEAADELLLHLGFLGLADRWEHA